MNSSLNNSISSSVIVSKDNKGNNTINHAEDFEFDFALCHGYSWHDCCRYCR